MNKVRTIRVNEIFKSIQGEGIYSGQPMHFVRVSGCNLKCIYCDTFETDTATELSIDEIMKKVSKPDFFPVYITGGEPLLQENTLFLIIRLISAGRQVHLDTNGTIDLSAVAPKACKAIDIKTPGSGASILFLKSNLDFITHNDEIKIIVTSKIDFDWAINEVKQMKVLEKTPNVIFQPAWGMVDAKDLAEWVKSCDIPVRLGLQIHKVIWGPDVKGV